MFLDCRDSGCCCRCSRVWSQTGFDGFNRRSLCSQSLTASFQLPFTLHCRLPAEKGTAYVPSSVNAKCHAHDHLKSHAAFDISSQLWIGTVTNAFGMLHSLFIHLDSLLRPIISDCLSTAESKLRVIYEGHLIDQVFFGSCELFYVITLTAQTWLT